MISVILAVSIVSVVIYSNTFESVQKTVIIDATPKKQVMSLTENAIKLYKETGADNAFNEITFGDDHLFYEFYVFVVNAENGEIVAHGGNSTRIGNTLENPDNNPVRDIILSESSPNGKWVKYSWINPLTQESQPKKSFIKTYDGYIFGSGFYLTPTNSTE